MKCKIITTTKQCEEHSLSLFGDIDEPLLDSDPYNGLNPHEIDTITTYYDGEITEENGEVRISYHEDDASGMGGVEAVIAFKRDCGSEVTITRSGSVNTIMLFSQGKRTISVYQTPFMPFELGIYARRVNNQIIERGVLEISYIIEIKGALAQKTEMKLEIKKDD